jgi:hypothetical protein
MIPTGGQEGELRVWELRSRELVSHLKQHGQRVPAVALYSDDSHAIRSVLAFTTLLSTAARMLTSVYAATLAMLPLLLTLLMATYPSTSVFVCANCMRLCFWCVL